MECAWREGRGREMVVSRVQAFVLVNLFCGRIGREIYIDGVILQKPVVGC